MKIFRSVAVALALAGAVPGSADDIAPTAAATDARPALIPVERFADRPLFSSVSIAPDGRHIAVKTTAAGEGILAVLDLDTRKAIARVKLGGELGYNWHKWAGPDVLLVSVAQTQLLFDQETRVTRMIALNIVTGQQWLIGPDAMGPEGDDLLHVAQDGSSVLLSFQKTVYDWPSVHRISLTDPKDRGKQVQSAVDGIWEWYADDKGVVRLGTGWSSGKMRVTYRKTDGERFREIARIGEDDEDALRDVQRIIGDSDEAYILDKAPDGRTVLVRYDLAKREALETIYRNDDWDLSSAFLDENGKPIAVDFTDDRDRRIWLEPEAAALQRKFEEALKADEVWIGSRADGGTRMLVTAGGETDPGVLYLYDASRKSLDELGQYRPQLDIAQLARPKPMSYTARDGTRISGLLTLPRGRAAKGLPLIVLPHGGPYGVRDKLEYSDEVQFLANRGYAVLQPNYRGSGGYGDAFFDLGAGQIGRAMQDDIDDAMDWAVGQGIADKGRVCVIGSSYGGYAAMWAAIRNPERYRCAASFAGVSDWKKILKYDAKFFSRSAAKKWKSRVTGEDKFDLDTVAPARAIERLKVPLLVSHGRKDANVPFSQFKLVEEAARKAGVGIETLVFDDEGHGFEKAENEARWYAALEAFLAKHNPADGPNG